MKIRALYLYFNYIMSETEKLQILGILSKEVRGSLPGADYSKNIGENLCGVLTYICFSCPGISIHTS